MDKLISDAFSGTQTDYVEEILDKNGNHMRKEVHQGPGFKTVEITSDNPMTDADIGNIIQDLIMQSMM